MPWRSLQYSEGWWGREAYTEITLIIASAKMEPCSITVTYKIREQGRDEVKETENMTTGIVPESQIWMQFLD